MDTPRVHIYIHDSSKDIFYELENLSEIRDRTIVKLYEADSSGRGPSGLGPLGLPPITNTEEADAVIGNLLQIYILVSLSFFDLANLYLRRS